jgi:hypothetical protein
MDMYPSGVNHNIQDPKGAIKSSPPLKCGNQPTQRRHQHHKINALLNAAKVELVASLSLRKVLVSKESSLHMG